MTFENEEPMVFEMETEDGEKINIELVETFEDNGKTYALAYDLSNDTDSYILEVVHHDEGDELVSIDDEEEFMRLCKIVEELEAEYAAEYDAEFEDEESAEE